MTEEDHERNKLLRSEAYTRDDITPHHATGKPPRTYENPLPRPALDADNMPLPRRVNEIDMDGTRVTPAAYHIPSQPARPTSAQRQSPPSQPPFDTRQIFGCAVYGLIGLFFVGVVLALIVVSFAVFSYYSIARTLPGVDDLRSRASQFETTRILDRNGAVLYEILDPNAGRRTYVPLDKISPYVVASTIATEDQDFYSHPGFDFWAIVRALWENYRTGGQGGGASTITQQLARALLLTPEERAQRTVSRKAREIVLAAELTRRYTKDEILELYLNEIYYGNLSYGIEAAAETYFHTTASQLTFAQASFLAGLPQSPAIYDIYTDRDSTLTRHEQVLVLMFTLSQQRSCIEVSNSSERVCVDATSATQAADEIRNYNFPPLDFNMRYPHWVNYIRSLLESKYDAQTIYRSGFTVTTTLDPQLQDEAQRILTNQIAQLTDKNARNGALVAIKPSTGEILAMVGSADFENVEIDGQINMAISQTRQPGSSIKPIAYVAAFEKGWTPATLIWDVPSEFPPSGVSTDTRPPYIPSNYDGKFHGPVTVRVALANSFNIPAVKTLNFIGVYDDPTTPQKDGMIAMAERLGITSLTAPDYGLALTLGGGEVSLLEMTSAYSVFANEGKRVPPVAILKITDFAGNVIDEYKPVPGDQVIRAEHAYLISSILSDNEARSWMFGNNSVLNLPFPAAAKTGTSGTPRGDAAELVYDNWTLGYTPDIVTGVWIGNADYTPMVNTSGSTGAAPIWSQFMQYAAPIVSGGNLRAFVPPAGIVQKVVCALSGAEPSQWCRGGQKNEVFASDQPPLPASKDLFRRVKIDTWSGLEASAVCGENFVEEVMAIRVDDPWARKWLESDPGQNWLESNNLPRKPVFAPERECTASDPHPTLEFSNLKDGDVVRDTELEIRGTADATGGFKSWALDFGQVDDPGTWYTVIENNQPVRNNVLTTLDMITVPNGIFFLRLRIEGPNGAYAEKIIQLVLHLPNPPTEIPPTEIPPTEIPPTGIPTVTPTATSVPPTIVPPTDVPTATPTATEVPPTDIPTATETETPTLPPP
jgi:membrane peptidoglycan carboxypeptidase